MKRFWGFITPIFVIALVTGATTPQMASADDAISAKVQELEQQIEQLKAALDDLKQQAGQPSPVVQDLSSRVTRVEQETQERPVTRVSNLEERIARVERVKKKRNTQVFFRGGYGDFLQDRGNQVFTDLFGVTPELTQAVDPAATNFNDGTDAYYIGAGIEHSMTDNLWGYRDGIEIWAEIMFEWKRHESRDETGDGTIRVVPGATVQLTRTNNAADPAVGDLSATATTGGAGGRVIPFGGESVVQGRALSNVAGVTVSQFTLSAAPKIKFPGWYGVKPWIIPGGLAFHVISPPSNAGTYIAPGAMFAGGVEYDITHFLTIGADGRYHFVADELDGVDSDHWTAGGYVGFKF